MSPQDIPAERRPGSCAEPGAAAPPQLLPHAPALRPMYPSSRAESDSPERPGGSASFECGIAAGFVTTAVLNPWDRALYLAVVNQRPFLSRANWTEPYRGLSQTLAQRSISSGIYFPLEEVCSRATGSHALGGQAGGMLCGVILNPLSFIKYQIWKEDEKRRSFLSSAKRMYRHAGPLVFFRGAISTVIRDGTFGFCFSLRKYFQVGSSGGQQHETSDFAVAMLCAALGTTLSSPFNYVRNMAYAESTKARLETWPSKLSFWRTHFGGLFRGAAEQESLWASLTFLQSKMQLGWGTARVAVGMALTDTLYKACSRAG